MSEEAANAMNSITVYEARTLYVSCGLITIIGNAQVTKITTQGDTSAENERCALGY